LVVLDAVECGNEVGDVLFRFRGHEVVLEECELVAVPYVLVYYTILLKHL